MADGQGGGIEHSWRPIRTAAAPHPNKSQSSRESIKGCSWMSSFCLSTDGAWFLSLNAHLLHRTNSSFPQCPWERPWPLDPATSLPTTLSRRCLCPAHSNGESLTSYCSSDKQMDHHVSNSSATQPSVLYRRLPSSTAKRLPVQILLCLHPAVPFICSLSLWMCFTCLWCCSGTPWDVYDTAHNQNSVFPSFLLSFSGCAASSIKKSALCDRGLAKRNFSQVCRVLCTKLKQHGRHRPVGSRQGFFLGLDLSSAL